MSKALSFLKHKFQINDEKELEEKLFWTPLEDLCKLFEEYKTYSTSEEDKVIITKLESQTVLPKIIFCDKCGEKVLRPNPKACPTNGIMYCETCIKN